MHFFKSLAKRLTFFTRPLFYRTKTSKVQARLELVENEDDDSGFSVNGRRIHNGKNLPIYE